MHLASTFLPVTQVDTGDSLLEAGTTDRGRHEADRGRHEAELWMKTYGICGSPRVPILTMQQQQFFINEVFFEKINVQCNTNNEIKSGINEFCEMANMP
ncbi:hypothetical protein T4C_8190 [Trichinella pseudospiralis]|uniref:Uncharacterized protein n=1 Tax=Trichinella pseudospiralis TaxID=6337 RepID=A0A0V1J078_TRIPS|nr:hypothetical protein T4C_8190 [Trichinella pseudospiralis]